MAERHHSQEQLLVSSRTTQYQVLFLVMPQAPREIGTGRRIEEKGIEAHPQELRWKWDIQTDEIQCWNQRAIGRRRRRRRTYVEGAHGMKNKGRKATGRLWSGGAGRNRGRGEKEMELSATLLPVLVKCCLLSERQPRMCQPSHLTLPNGLLNADIKLTRSFTLPFSSLSLSLSLHFALITSPLTLSLTLSLTCPLPLFYLLSVALPINHSLARFPIFFRHLAKPSAASFNYSPLTPFVAGCFLYYTCFFADQVIICLSSQFLPLC